MLRFFLTAFFACWLCADLYLWFSFVRHAALIWKMLYWLPMLAFVVMMIVTFTGSRISLNAWLPLLIFFLLQIVVTILSLIGRLVGLAWHPAFPIFNVIGLTFALFAFIIVGYGMLVGFHDLRVRQVNITVPGLPDAFEGYQIAHLSDLHVGTHGKKTKFITQVVAEVNDAHPDLIVFTGDLVNIHPEELTPYREVLSSLQTPDGVISVLGNHDYCMYGYRDERDWRQATEQVAAQERSFGWTLLRNDHCFIHRGDDSIAVAGVEYCGGMNVNSFVDLPAAIQGISDSTFTLLLDHNPAHWKMEVVPNTHIPLTLAGHTHAAQIKLFGWSPAQWMFKEWSGLYQEDGQQLYVSEGTGGTIAFRFGTKPEIVMITLHSAKR
ncbi:MAG: metallophosphoesterase [Bacteroidales bacterium]|nr:metallophosphoesterase [Bacteroidales bacterium]